MVQGDLDVVVAEHTPGGGDPLVVDLRVSHGRSRVASPGVEPTGWATTALPARRLTPPSWILGALGRIRTCDTRFRNRPGGVVDRAAASIRAGRVRWFVSGCPPDPASCRHVDGQWMGKPETVFRSVRQGRPARQGHRRVPCRSGPRDPRARQAPLASRDPRPPHITGASNGPTEGLNLCVKKVKRCGHEFRTFEHYRRPRPPPHRPRHLADTTPATPDPISPSTSIRVEPMILSVEENRQCRRRGTPATASR